MVASFSPHREAGGTLHLPSPNGIHVNPSVAIKQLRRSLSRSPSKGSDFRLLARPNSPSKHTHYISSPLSPSRRASQGNLFLVSANSLPSPLAVPYPPSARINRPGIRRTTSFQPPRSRTTPSSPTKRVLLDSRDSGNSITSPLVVEKSEEPVPPLQLSPTEITSTPELACGDSTLNQPADSSFAQMPVSRVEKRRSGTFRPFPSTSSPLKRSDVVMNLDQTPLRSPSAKRRSVHGASFTSDFNLFEAENSIGSTTDKQPNQNESDPAISNLSQVSSNFSVIPKRSSSLRKSTLQQRQSERSLFSRARAGTENDTESIPNSPIFLRSNQPKSFDGHLFFSVPRDGSSSSHIFSNSSATLFSSHANHKSTQTPHPAPHPLSRTITQSSSSSSLVDDSPTHGPINRFEKPRPILNFSKSLPTGSTRPVGPSQLSQENPDTSTESFATPENYKLVKPLPAAFMSTGLISKKNRNVDDVHNVSITSKNMPDTPCKRPLNMFPGVHKPLPQSATEKTRSNGPSSGTPWTPFTQQHSTASPHPGPFSKGMSIFGNFYAKSTISRRGSFVSVDGDDLSQSQSPSRKNDSQSTNDTELPPTPTKQTFFPSGSHFSKSRPHRPTHSQTPSFDSLCGPSGPCSSPLGNKSLGRDSPHTPQEHILPPDPSGLSISAQGDRRSNPQDHRSSVLPATPTAPREYFAPVGKKASLSLGGYNAPDIDPSLTSRFEKVELVGTGEFSQVYRVTEPQSTTPFGSPFQPTSFSQTHEKQNKTTAVTRAERVWAVKKSNQPCTGPKDRERRNNEVVALKALANCDYIISYADSWEYNNILYIQTEFCEEGSLDLFLSQVGLKARLDDFRIWKILLELSLGLKHVHDSGFIHLDLKPANVLITFEGVLKIADFGMASRWPAAAGIEGEGDREYIGPEVLMGCYDKPADIFALGLIMFEIAGNVELPDNGVSWQKLRNGDMSDVPSLTWSLETSKILRDASGNPLPDNNCTFEQLCASDSDEQQHFTDSHSVIGHNSINGNDLSPFGSCGKQPFSYVRRGELAEPPDFMIDATNEQALDTIVRWMISPDPADRPIADQIIQTFGVQWAERRRRAGATIYEGNWGPADEVLAEDAEMIDV
ncbi:conserved hypothetical protein [Histoplasma capsulatum H143]|uniref:Protein kinase domain-containing protein n=1 Tax=Ajellomyces capsulatus (strain H143) TaxID=544712 RepID=C6HT39_AJECH|nr:conserved hypothetical protein [Histoplasma capsulatum H143]